jgi:cobyrinic acid a,c-diamide synthase
MGAGPTVIFILLLILFIKAILIVQGFAISIDLIDVIFHGYNFGGSDSCLGSVSEHAA